MAPGLADRRRVERHPRQPGARLALELHLIGADHPLRHLAFLALIEELLIGSEVVLELLGGQLALVAEVNLLEGIAVLVAHVAGHVDAIEERIVWIYRGDTLG